MIFSTGNRKYDTKKMKLISEKCQWEYTMDNITGKKYYAENVKLWQTTRNEYVLTYETLYYPNCFQVIEESRAKDYLFRYDHEAYEKIFGKEGANA